MNQKLSRSALFCFLSLLIPAGGALHGQQVESLKSLSRAFREAAKTATPSVVTVVAYGQNVQKPSENNSDDNTDDENPPNVLDEAPNSNELLPATGLGSGVIISGEGVILTNNHVIRGAQRAVVRLHDGLEISTTDFIGDPSSDIAILKISSEEELVAAKIGDSSAMEIGDWVLAIGSPFHLDATVSAGIISATSRRLQAIKRGRLLQTDAAINPGNSGGPLINLDGEVIGISTAIATRNGSYQGIGFAVPINQAKWIAQELDEHGGVRRASIGVALAALNAGIARRLDLPMKQGILVVSVTKDRAAEKAGVKPYDVILEFDGEKITKPRQLQESIEREPIDSEHILKVYREGEELQLTVTLEESS